MDTQPARTAADAFREAAPSGGVEFPRDEDTQARALTSPVPTPEPTSPASPLTTPYQNGVPVMTSASGPVAGSMGTPIREGPYPGFGTQAAGSMASDPEQRRRILARQLYPNMPQLKAEERVFYGAPGRLAAVGDDGKAYFIDPLRKEYAPDPLNPSTYLPDNPLPRLGTYAGPALPAGGAIIGGMAAGPTSLVAGPIAAGAGAGVGDAIRQTVAQQLDPGVPTKAGPRVPDYNVGQTTREALGAALGQLLGAGFTRGLRVNPMGTSDYDLRTLREPVVQQRIADNYARADAQGVKLTPGQASGLPSLINLEDVYVSGNAGPQGADVAGRFYEKQRPQVVGAFDAATGRVSPAADKTDAALQFQQGSVDAERIVRQQANTQAKPFYDAARAAGQKTSPDLDILADVPAVKTAMEAAYKEYADKFRVPPPNAPNFDIWNLTKIKLDEAHAAAKLAGQNSTASSLDALRTDLRAHLDAVYPTYETARATAAPGLREAARLEDIAGRGGSGMGTERVGEIVNPVFKGNNPRAVLDARTSFIKAGKEDEWNAGVRAYMQDVFDKTVQSQEGLNPQMLRRQLWADPNVKEVMRHAMDPTAFAGFERMMGTLEDVARSRGMNSLTSTRQAAAQDLKTASRDTPGIKLLGALRYLSLEAVPRGAETIQNWMAQRNVARIGEYLFSENGQAYLRQMAKMPPGARSITATARFLGQQEGLRTAPPTQMVAPEQQINIPRAAEGLLNLR